MGSRDQITLVRDPCTDARRLQDNWFGYGARVLEALNVKAAGRVRFHRPERRDSPRGAAAAVTAAPAGRFRVPGGDLWRTPGIAGAVASALLLTACSSGGSQPPPARHTAAPPATAIAPSGPATGISPAAAEGPWIDQPVSFQAGAMTVYATYRHPAGLASAGAGQSIPAVLLIQGNDFTDRNGNTPQFPGSINEIRAIADWLSADGVASLRFDRLGSGQTGFGPYASKRGIIQLDPLPFEPVEQEAAAALKFLARQRGINRARLGVIAHSQGAEYALLLALGTDPEGSGSGPLPHVRALGLFEPYRSSLVGGWEGGPYDPARLAARLHTGTPVLITCSNADLQVSCADISPVRAGLVSAQAATDFVQLTGVDHVLKQDPTGFGGNYTKPLRFSRQLRQALRSFVKLNL